MKKLIALLLLVCGVASAQVGPGSPSHFLAPSNAPLGSYATEATLTAAWPASQLGTGGGQTAYVQDGTGPVFWNGSSWVQYSTGSSAGLTSVGLADTSTTPLYTISNSPLTANGTLDFTLNTQAAHCFVGGPTSGSAAQPTCRALVASDIPTIPASGISGLATVATSGLASDVSGLATIATSGAITDATGTLLVAHGGNGLTTATLGDLRYGSGTNTLAILAGNTTSAKNFLTQTGTGAVSAIPVWGTIANTDVAGLGTLSTQSGTFSGTSSGTNTGDQTITLTGDSTGSGTGSFPTTVGKLNGTTLSALATGILKNTTGTGVPSIAVAADITALTPGAAATDVQVFTAAGANTWTKPAGTPKTTRVILIGPGGGGGSGGAIAIGTAISGGGGGGGGGYVEAQFATASLGTTETVTLGTGGAGGGAKAGVGTGNNGQPGSADSTFGTWLTARLGGGGAPGAASASSGGGGGGSFYQDGGSTTTAAAGSAGVSGGGAGGSGTTGATAYNGGGGGGGSAASATSIAGGAGYTGGGGAGGGMNTTTAAAGGNGGLSWGAAFTAGGAIATIGNTGTVSAAAYLGGSGGSGGGSNTTGTSGGGGPGIQGSGGGGSGAGTAGSAVGGKGGDGYCVVITYY